MIEMEEMEEIAALCLNLLRIPDDSEPVIVDMNVITMRRKLVSQFLTVS